jgi:hypothetical protein
MNFTFGHFGGQNMSLLAALKIGLSPIYHYFKHPPNDEVLTFRLLKSLVF